MKRVAAILLVVAAAVVVAVLALGASNDDDGNGNGPYKVRAIFDSAFAVIPGEDVKIAGVEVGQIESLDVTDDKRAAIVLNINKPGFGDWREDATCIIRPQSLIGEKFVECTPTQPRGSDEPAPPLLKKIEDGPGKGQFLLPVQNTRRSVDLDLINSIYQLPERQRLTIILNELGTGLAGRGADLNEVIRRANPALMETDKVLAILKEQNQVLADLAVESDTVLQPLAEDREQVADFITQAKDVSQATAKHRGALEENFEKLPVFLTELRPTLRRLGDLSDEMTPVLTDLGSQADNINTLIERMGPLAQAGREAFPSLGEAADAGTQAMKDIRPITEDVNELAASAQPLASDLNSLLVSLRDTGGIERVMDYVFFQMTAINGFDSAGHYLRAGLLLNTCSTYAVEKAIGCEATFSRAGTTRSVADEGRSVSLLRQEAVANGMTVEQAFAAYPKGSTRNTTAAGAGAKSTAKSSGSGSRADAPIRMPSAVLPGSATQTAPPAAPAAPATATPPTATTPAAPAADDGSAAASEDATGRLLDYLLGGGS